MGAQKRNMNAKSPWELARELRVLADQLESAYTAKEVAAVQDMLVSTMIEMGVTAAALAFLPSS